MSIQAVKLEIVKQVLSTENPKILNQILSLVKSSKEDFWNTLSQKEQEEILAGIADLDAGKRKSYASVMKKLRK